MPQIATFFSKLLWQIYFSGQLERCTRTYCSQIGIQNHAFEQEAYVIIGLQFWNFGVLETNQIIYSRILFNSTNRQYRENQHGLAMYAPNRSPVWEVPNNSFLTFMNFQSIFSSLRVFSVLFGPSKVCDYYEECLTIFHQSIKIPTSLYTWTFSDVSQTGDMSFANPVFPQSFLS